MKQPDPQIEVFDEMIGIRDMRLGIRRIIPERAMPEPPTLVFLHDALGSIAQWRDFPGLLVKACRLPGLLIERQGHGRSDPMPEKRDKYYLHREAYEILPAVLDALQVRRPLLVGHSDGATLALLYAAKFQPEAVVSIAAHVFVEDITVLSIQSNLREREVLQSKLARYHHDKAEALVGAWSGTWLWDEFRDFNIEQEIRTVQAPTLIIQSADDEYGTRKQVDSIRRQIASKVKEVLWLEDGGHMLHLTRTQFLVDHILDFLRENVLSADR